MIVTGIMIFKWAKENKKTNDIIDDIKNTISVDKNIDNKDKYNVNFEQARKQMTVCGTEYPQMKILDSCFWQVGFDLDENKGLKISH